MTQTCEKPARRGREPSNTSNGLQHWKSTSCGELRMTDRSYHAKPAAHACPSPVLSSFLLSGTPWKKRLLLVHGALKL
ncbi:hypothetical protein GW17_00016491 [Ensete ventricosum]|nr:hypothetical protein GW17_00016491 [Ensete ventricosum]